jgi:hypothetical protein
VTPDGTESPIPVVLHTSRPKECLLVRFVFRDEPNAEAIETFQAIARSWAQVGLYGGFGGALKEFAGDPTFQVERMGSGEVVYETILDLGSAPYNLAMEILLRALGSYAALVSMPLDRVEVGGE